MVKKPWESIKETPKTTNKEKNLGGLRVPRHQVTWYFPTGWISPFSWRLSPRLSWISFLAGCVKGELWDWCTQLGPENGTFERRDSFWKPSCSGFILVFRWGVLHSPKVCPWKNRPGRKRKFIWTNPWFSGAKIVSWRVAMPWVFQPSKDDIFLANKGFSLDFLSLKHVFFVILVTGILGGGDPSFTVWI